MGHKVFVSYKFADDEVESRFPRNLRPTTVRDYVNVFESRIRHLCDYIYKGEEDGEDLSKFTDDQIWDKLKDRMYDSSVTVLFISPNMKEPYKWERNQWIPWEISYSLREVTRNGRQSHNNAIVAAILPDRNGNYGYFKEMPQFKIVKNNLSNGYIEPVVWHDFIDRPDRYIELAIKKVDTFPEYRLDKTVD